MATKKHLIVPSITDCVPVDGPLSPAAQMERRLGRLRATEKLPCTVHTLLQELLPAPYPSLMVEMHSEMHGDQMTSNVIRLHGGMTSGSGREGGDVALQFAPEGYGHKFWLRTPFQFEPYISSPRRPLQVPVKSPIHSPLEQWAKRAVELEDLIEAAVELVRYFETHKISRSQAMAMWPRLSDMVSLETLSRFKPPKTSIIQMEHALRTPTVTLDKIETLFAKASMLPEGVELQAWLVGVEHG